MVVTAFIGFNSNRCNSERGFALRCALPLAFQFQQVQFRASIEPFSSESKFCFNSNRCNSELIKLRFHEAENRVSIPTGAIQRPKSTRRPPNFASAKKRSKRSMRLWRKSGLRRNLLSATPEPKSPKKTSLTSFPPGRRSRWKSWPSKNNRSS